MNRFRAWWCLAFALCLAGCSRKQVGTVLVYQIDNRGGTAGAKVDPQALVRAVERRVNSRLAAYGKVELQPNGEISVAVYGYDAADLDRVKRMLSYTGLLEFRILANTHDHAELIKQAQASRSREVIDPKREGASKLAARWLAVAKKDEDPMRQNPLVVSRDDESGGLQVLVVQDDLDLTGEYLKSVQARYDQNGQPSVHFALDTNGSQKLGEITTANLPDHVRGFKRQLAIILDGTIVTAPSINSVIYDECEITGTFTASETEELAAVLLAGPFSAPIKLMNETRIAPQRLWPYF
jgi:preprotein translocase subunit SecD